jgi:uncharacterized membrane protein
VLFAALFIVFRRVKSTKKINKHLYTSRQLQIINYLQKHGPANQIKIEKELNIPKASLSRNIETLVKKGIIFKESKGMSNIIGLKD